MWTLRKAFWDQLSVLKFRANKPRPVPVPDADGRQLVPIPLGQRYPGIPILDIPVADHVPADESMRARLLFCKVQAVLCRHFPSMQPGLPEIDADQHAALAAAYTRRHEKCLAFPVLPEEYAGPVDLGALAVAGPYACYLQRSPMGDYEWDLRHLDKYEHHRGLRSLGVHVRFEVDERAQRLSAVEIDSELGICTPADASWPLAQKMALCAATNHLSLVRHFNWVHLTTVAQFAISTRNVLAPDHPVRRLLWPHIWGTGYSNELVTEVLMMEGGDFESVFSFTHAGLCNLFEDSFGQFDIRVIDPVADAERRGIVDGGFPLPYLENRRAHFDVMHDHVRRYLRIYYRSEGELTGDSMLMAWVDDLDRRLPNGVKALAGEPVTLEGLARLLAGFVYFGSVEHEVLGTGLWNYQVWPEVQPTRMYRSGRRESLDVYQRLVNYNFMLNVRRSPLLQDLSHLALDPAGAAAFRTFLEELRALQDRLDREPPAYWKVSPRILEVGVNG